jgi:hypothetical protein
MIIKEDFYDLRVRPKAYWFWKSRESARRERNWLMAENIIRQDGLTSTNLQEEAERISRDMAPVDALTDWVDAELFEAKIILDDMNHDIIQAIGREIAFIGDRVETLVRYTQ